MSERLTPSDFLSSLATLLASASSSSSSSSNTNIHLTQKPLPSNSNSNSDSPSPSSPPPPQQILIRASNGYHVPHPKTRVAKHLLPLRKPGDKRIKISTVVDAAEIEDFYARYAEVCKKGMDGLRKRDKKKAKAKAKKKHQHQNQNQNQQQKQ